MSFLYREPTAPWSLSLQLRLVADSRRLSAKLQLHSQLPPLLQGLSRYRVSSGALAAKGHGRAPGRNESCRLKMNFPAGSVREGTHFLLVAARVKFAMQRTQTTADRQQANPRAVG